MRTRGEQLKGCPFCGSDKVAIDADCGRHHFKCHGCGMSFEFSADTKTELIRKWNRRAQPLERAEAAEAEARRTTGDEVETPRRGGGVMDRGKAVELLCAIADERGRTVDEVTALEMAARRILARHFQRERNWARRRAKRAGGHEEVK